MRSRKIRRGAVAVLAVASLGLAGCASDDDGDTNEPQSAGGTWPGEGNADCEGLEQLSEFGAIYWPRVKVLNPAKSVFGSAATSAGSATGPEPKPTCANKAKPRIATACSTPKIHSPRLTPVFSSHIAPRMPPAKLAQRPAFLATNPI